MASIKEHLKLYCQATSVKGVSKAVKSKHVPSRLLWLLAVFCGACIAGFLLVTLVMAYLKFESSAQIIQCSNCKPQFPDVTVCNLHPLALLSLFHDDLLQFYDYFHVLHVMHGRLKAIFQTLEGDPKYGNMTLDQISYMYFGIFYSLAGYFHNVNKTKLLEKLGDSRINGSFVNFCEWYDWEDRRYTKEDCMTQSLYFFTTPDYSVCTTIHMNDTNASSNNTDVKGFEAILYLNDFHRAFMIGYEHNILQSQARGARVLIHPANTLPEMRKGFNIAPGHEVSIHLEAREVTHQPAPYSDCIDQQYLEEVDAPVGVSHEILQFMYNDQDAYSLCQQENIVRKCGCFHPSLPVTKHLQSKYNVSGCIRLMYEDMSRHLSEVNISDIDIESSMKNIDCYLFAGEDKEQKQQIEENCLFRQPCKQTTYSHRVYQSPWPHESYQLSFYCRHIKRQDPMCWKVGKLEGQTYLGQHFTKYTEALGTLYYEDISQTYEKLLKEDLLQRNFIQLKVNFLEKKKEIYKEMPALTLASLTGTLGGVLNLWIGITFFTVIELVDLIFSIVLDGWIKREDKNVKQAQQKNKVHPLGECYTTVYK